MAEQSKSLKTADAQRLYASMVAADFRSELDALLKKHGLGMQIGHGGKWAKLQLTFVGHPDIPSSVALTLVAVDRGQRQRYVTEVEENAGIDCKCGFTGHDGGGVR